jgi:hypothetical protein
MKKIVLIFSFFVSWEALSASSLDSVPYGRHAFSFEYRGAAGKWGAFYDYTILKSKDARFLSSIGIGLGRPNYYNGERNFESTYVVPLRMIFTYRYQQVFLELGYIGMYSRKYIKALSYSIDRGYASSPHLGLRWQSHKRHGLEVRGYWMCLVTKNAPFVYDLNLPDSGGWGGHDPDISKKSVYSWWGLGLGYHF